MKRIFLKWVISIVAVAITVWLANQIGVVLEWPAPWRIAVFVPVLALANATIRPILKFFTLPLTCLTLGLFGFIINALVFWLAGAVTGAKMSFLGALFGSVVMTIVAAPMNRFIKERD